MFDIIIKRNLSDLNNQMGVIVRYGTKQEICSEDIYGPETAEDTKGDL